MAAHAAYRLHAMAANAANVVAIELLAAAQGCDFLAPLLSSAPLERLRALIRSRVPTLVEDRLFAPDIAAVAGLVAADEVGRAVELAALAA